LTKDCDKKNDFSEKKRGERGGVSAIRFRVVDGRRRGLSFGGLRFVGRRGDRRGFGEVGFFRERWR